MRIFHTVPGMKLDRPEYLPKWVQSAEGRALAGIPGWRALFDPAVRSGGGLKNRVEPDQSALPNIAWTLVEFDNFALPVSPPAPALARRNAVDNPVYGQFNFNPTAWTVFSVINATNGTTVVPTVGRPLVEPIFPFVGTGYCPRITIRTTGQLAAYTTDGTIRIQGPGVVDGTNRLVMVTFSVANGMRMFYNGVLVSSEPSAVQPLNEHYLAGQHTWFAGNSGSGQLRFGMTGVLDRDLSTSDGVQARKAIETFMRTKYALV